MSFILFVPAYGQGGTGELVRATTLAVAVSHRRPAMRIEFLLPHAAGGIPPPFTCYTHGDDGSSKEQFNNQQIERLRPDLVVFDGGIRPSSVALCRRLGIRSAFVSHYEKSRRKAFRLGSLRSLDAHWHQRTANAGTLPPLLRLLDRFSTTERLVFDTCLASEPTNDSDLPAEVTQPLSKPFVLLTPGGGGVRCNGEPVGNLYVKVAEHLHAATGLACLTVLGPLHEGPVPTQRTIAVKQLEAGRIVALMRRAQLVVVNGGGSLGEAIACGAPCVAAPFNAVEQPLRIAAYARAGLVAPAEPTVQSLTAQAVALLDPARQAEQRQRLSGSRFVDGIPLMCEAIVQLLGKPRRAQR